MVILPFGSMPVSFHELRNRAPLHADPGADQGNLVGEIEQIARAQTLPHLQLRRRLQQKYPLRQARVDHVVHLGVLRVYPAQIGPLPLPQFDQIECLLQLVENRQRENIDLGEARVRHAVLVPVHDKSALYRPRPHRNHLRQRRTAEDHPAHVLAQQLGRAHQLRRQFDQFPPAAGVHPLTEGRQLRHLLSQERGIMRTHLLREQAQLLLRQPQSLAQIPQHPLYLVGEDRAGQHRILRPEPPVDPLDQLVAQCPRKVEVDVRQHRHVRREKTFQREIPLEGIDMADADQISHQQRHR